MATATQTFHVTDPVTRERLLFEDGDPVPDHIAAIVGDHVVSDRPEGQAQGGESPFDGEAFDAAVKAAVEAEVAVEVQKAVEAYKEREQAAYDALAEQDEPFDPAADGVTAPKVKEYLESLDQGTVNGSAEYDRVVELEKAGPNRSSAIPS